MRQYGAAFERLSNRERAPPTMAQEQFVDAARGKRPTEAVPEHAYPEKLTKRVEKDCFRWHNGCAINPSYGATELGRPNANALGGATPAVFGRRGALASVAPDTAPGFCVEFR